MRNPLAALLLLFNMAAPAMAQETALKIGQDRFNFDYQDAVKIRPITVWSYRPKEMSPNAAVLFVMHGVQRDAERYRNEWQPYAERAKALLLVPEFAAENFPGGGGYAAAKQDAASAALEKLFDHAIKLTGLNASDYPLYGHSAGAQFVHRFILSHPKARAKTAVAANAGWYMMPDFEVRFPYGLKASGLDATDLTAALGKKLLILLGDKDVDPKHPQLNRSAGAMRQGAHRLARGENFFRAARLAASQLNAPFQWEIATVAGADHNNAKMAVAAAPLLLK